MKKFPYLTDYVNDVFERERSRFDFIVLRPVLLTIYFFLRLFLFPFKFVLHRKPFGFEGYCIDSLLAFGIKYLASRDAIELIVRHVQIEPLLYRYILSGPNDVVPNRARTRLAGIDGDFSVDSVRDVIRHNLTLCHDDLSYEVTDRFDREAFLSNIAFLRTSKPEDHEQFSKKMLEENEKHSWQLLGCTNVVIGIVIVITIFGDLSSVVKALNSFDSDSLLLWCAERIYEEKTGVLIDLSFYLPPEGNRVHYHVSPFASDPCRYLYSHIAFDEYVYELLRSNAELLASEGK
ncbi:MAG: hypothetical protein KDD64_14535 [Bdellovibrionales bacterium]|nr:hypothetical protein [Bdellovibrionales bacterium]